MNRDRKLLWVISYHHACNDGALMALVALLPILISEMDLTYSEIGLLGFGLLVTVAVQLAVGRLSDRMFSRYMLELGAALMAISFVLIPLVSDFVGLFAAVMAMRVGASFYHPIGIGWISKEYAGPFLDTAMGIQSGIGNFGVIVAMASSGFLGEQLGWQMPCLLWAGLNVAAVIIGLTLTGDYEPRPAQRAKTFGTPLRTTFLKIGVLSLPIAAGGAFYQVTSYFGPINLTEMHGWTAGNADLMFAVWISVGTVTSYYFGRLSSALGRQFLLRAGYGVSCVACLLLAFASSWWAISLILIAFGATLFLTYPALFALVTESTTESERGGAFGILFGFQLGGGAVVVYLCGLLSDILDDPSQSFLVMFVLGAVSVMSLELWLRSSSKERTQFPTH